MIRVPSIMREVSYTGHKSTQVVVDVSSAPDSGSMDVPIEVIRITTGQICTNHTGHTGHSSRYMCRATGS